MSVSLIRVTFNLGQVFLEYVVNFLQNLSGQGCVRSSIIHLSFDHVLRWANLRSQINQRTLKHRKKTNADKCSAPSK